MAQFPLFTGANDVGELRAYLNRIVNALNNPTEVTTNLEVDGTLTVDGASTLTGAVTASSTAHIVGAATLDSTLGVTGDFAVATNKFTVAASSGNVAVAGTENVVGNFTVATNKLVVTASSGAVAAAGAIGSTANVGTAGTGVTAAEYGDGYAHTTVLTVNTTLPAIAGGASLGVGKLMYTLPAGAQMLGSSYFSMAITQTTGHINANTPKVGLGQTIAVGAVSVLNGTAGFMDVVTEQTAANCTGTATVITAIPTSGAAIISAAGGTKTVYFNVAAAWAASGDPAALLTGTVVLRWQFMN